MNENSSASFIDKLSEINKRKKKSLSTKLSVWFLLLAMTPMLLIAWVSYYQANKSLTQAAVSELEQSAELNVEFIQNWFDYRVMDISSQAEVKNHQYLLSSLKEGFELSGKTLKDYVDSADWVRRLDGKQSELTTLSYSYDYIYDVFLIDIDGNVLYTAVRESDLGTNIFNAPYSSTLFSKVVKRSLIGGEILFSDMERYEPSGNKLSMFLSAPVVNESEDVIGAFVIQINMERMMRMLEKSNSGHDKHYLVGEDGVIRTSFDRDENDVLIRKIQTKQFLAWHEKHVDMNMSEQGDHSGVGHDTTYIDPAGDEVIGLHHTVKIYNFEWVLISEVKKSLALKGADWLGQVILVFVVITGVLVTCLAFFQSRRITRPIESLVKASMAVAAGDRDQYVDVTSNDEIGRLAEAFNHMLVMRHMQEQALEQSHQETKQAHEESQKALVQIEEQSSKLLLARDDAEAAVRAKADFLASMSHEIRTPMNGVLGMMSLLLNSKLNKEQHHQVTLARSSAKSLLSVINDILDFSKIEAGKLEIESVDFNLRDILGEFSEAISHRSSEGDVELIVDATSVEYSLVRGDPGRVRQVLSNLVGNALKFTSKGEIVVRAVLHNEGAADLRLVCSVTDTGIGIPQEKLASLFDSFTQADSSTTRKYGGSGLGLAIVKQLCEMMGGGIRVSSELGSGSCFEFDLLLRRSESSAVVSPEVDITRMSILVVDDSVTHCDVLHKQLSRWGAAVTEAQTAEQALIEMSNKLDDKQQPIFTAIFIEQEMANVNGFELAKSIRSDARFDECKLVMMTSMSNRGSALLFAEKGFSAYFPKPTTTADLFEALKLVVEEPSEVRQDSKGILTDKVKWPESTRILMVEDNLVNQIVATALLDLIGLSCDIADNGKIALEVLSKTSLAEPYNLILMDCQMPEMDGYETTEAIRQGLVGEYYKKIDIIAMTANAMKGDKEKCLKAGMSDYLSKPIDTKVLEQKLYHWLVEMKPSKDTSTYQPLLNSKVDSVVEIIAEKSANNIELNTDTNELCLWDKTAALKRMLGKVKILKVLLTTFFADTPQYVEALAKEISDENYPAAAKSAHAIKGVAANLSALALADCAAKLERSCLDEKLNEIQNVKSKLQPYYDETVKLFEQYLEEEAK